MTTRRRALATVLLLFVAALLVQVAWVFAVSPFRAIDEFDHAQRADSVAGGHWTAVDGNQVVVRSDFAAAVRPVCDSRPRDDCAPTRELPGDEVEIRSSAASYNPLFYWVVGTAARPFHGYHELYAMRAAALVLNALVLAVALFIALVAFRTRWLFWTALLTWTPMATYGAMVVAPNGLEASAALLLWVSLLAATRLEGPWARSRLLPVSAAVAGILLGVLRSLGPFWLVCIIGACVLASGGVRRLVHHDGLRRADWASCAVAVLLAAGGGGAWSLLSGVNRIATGTVSASVASSASSASSSLAEAAARLGDGPSLTGLPGQVILWVFQSVGAIPYRDEPLPLAVYAIILIIWITVLVVGLRRAPRPIGLAVLAVAAVSLAVPVAVTVASYHQGWLWQGRYGWPLSMGVFLLVGLRLDADSPTLPQRVQAALPWLLGGALAVAVIVSQLHVDHDEHAKSPLAGTSAWITAPQALIGLLTTLGFALLVLVAVRSAPTGRAAPVAEGQSEDLDASDAVTH